MSREEMDLLSQKMKISGGQGRRFGLLGHTSHMLTYKRIQDTVSIAKSPTMLNTTDVEGAEVRGGKGRRERERERG